jgi:serine/threonine-protein kinase haspin
MIPEGDYQFDVYRIMREYNGGAWEDFNPLTNVMVRILRYHVQL